MTKKYALPFLLVLLTTTQAKAFQEPSNSEIHAAMVAKTESAKKTLKQANVIFNISFNKILKTGCVQPRQKPGVICEFKSDSTLSADGETKKIIGYATYRFVKVNSKWVAMEKISESIESMQ